MAQLFIRVGKLPANLVAATQQPPLAAPAPYGYRNKLQFTFSGNIWVPGGPGEQGSVTKGFGLGFLRPGSDREVLPVTSCLLQPPAGNAILSVVRELCQEMQLQPFDPDTNEGCLRYLIIRSSSSCNSSTAASGSSRNNSSSSTSMELGDVKGRKGARAIGRPTASTRIGASPGARSSDTFSTVVAAYEGSRGDQNAVGDSSPASSSISLQYMVVLVTTAQCKSADLDDFATRLREKVPEVVSVIHSIEGGALEATGRKGNSSRNRGRGRGARVSGAKGKQQQQSSQGVSPAWPEDGGIGGRSGQSGTSSSSTRPRRALGVASSVALAGVDSLKQQLCGLQFNISPHSFFQTNTEGAELLYQCTIAAAGLKSSDVVLDLYCGAGTIALALASQVKQVVGFDCNRSAIADATKNAASNGVGNASFVCGDLDQLARGDLGVLAIGVQEKVLGKVQGKESKGKAVKKGHLIEVEAQAVDKEGIRPDVVIVDPARAGLGPAVRKYLLDCGARRVVYVSCNAATQARDLQLLCNSGTTKAMRGSEGNVDDGQGFFTLKSWTAVDMFPQTDHVEAVAMMER